MMKRIVVATMTAAAVVAVLSGCVFPGTGTIRVRNEMTESRVITALYIYEVGTARGPSVASDIDPNETHTEYRVEPGDYVVEADVNFGAERAIDAVTVEEGTFHLVWISDSDLL